MTDNTFPKRPVALKTVLSEFNVSRTFIDTKCREGVLHKYKFAGSPRCYLDRDELEAAFIIVSPPKSEKP